LLPHHSLSPTTAKLSSDSLHSSFSRDSVVSLQLSPPCMMRDNGSCDSLITIGGASPDSIYLRTADNCNIEYPTFNATPHGMTKASSALSSVAVNDMKPPKKTMDFGPHCNAWSTHPYHLYVANRERTTCSPCAPPQPILGQRIWRPF
jgi:hypothetical protein